MKKQRNLIFILSGVCLIVAAAAATLLWQWRIADATEKNAAYVQTIGALTPAPQGAVPEERRDNTMPALSVEGTDFIGILEFPAYDSSLPVCAQWGEVSKYPCCFSGSVYDRTIQIGGTTQKGQYDFYRDISVGDALYFTDMRGNRYAYAVTDVRYASHADQATLSREDASLTLFIKNVYAFEYIIIYCDTAS